MSRPIGLASHSAFASGLGADFQARGATGSTVLRLVDILDVPRTTRADELSFILIFQAAGRGVPDCGTYRLTTRGVPA